MSRFNAQGVFVFFVGLAIAFASTGQEEEVFGVKSNHAWNDILKAYADQESGEIDIPSPDWRNKEFFNEVELDWNCLGPNDQPAEMNPGGKAIPTYSIGRGNGTGRINFLLVNPDEEDNVFACSPTGGLFVTWDGGKSWECAGTDNLPVSGVASVTINPFDPHNWVIATGDGDDKFMFSDGIWRTFDAGQTWENINGGRESTSIPVSERNSDWTFCGKILAHPCDFNRIFVTTNKGLFMTGNALEEDPTKVEWTKVAEGQYYDVEIVPWAESLVFASGTKMMWSKNCGNDWEELPMPGWDDQSKYPFTRLQMELTSNDPDHLYVAVSCAERHGMGGVGSATFQKYNYRTKRWSEVRSLKKSMNNVIPTRGRAFAVDPRDSSLILTANVQPIYRSTDGGQNFDRIERGQMHDDVHHIVFSPDSSRVWAAHDGGVSVSYDKGVSWQPMDNGIGVANIFGLSVAQSEDTQVLYGGYDTGGNLYKNGEWYHVTWGDGFQTVIDHSDPDVMYATKQNGHINRTMDGGDDWNKSVTCGLTSTEWHTWIRINPEYSNVLYCSGKQLVRSMSYGENWETILEPKDFGGDTLKTVYRFYLSETNPDVLYAYVLSKNSKGSTPVLFRTFNVNEEKPELIKWEVLTVPVSGWLGGLAIDPDDPEKFWMAYLSHKPENKVFRYTGSKWIDIGKDLGYAVIEDMIVEKDSDERLYIGTNYGVFTRNKLENEWTLLTGLPGAYVKSLGINYVTNTLFAGTYGRGVWTTPTYRPAPVPEEE